MDFTAFIKEKSHVCGIYSIVCSETWRSYVGQSADIGKHAQIHLGRLRSENHINPELQKDFILYGESKFYFEVLEEVSNHKDLGKREAYWKDYGCNLYNVTENNRKIILTDYQTLIFWDKVKILTKDECWEWTGPKDKDDYGRTGFSTNGKGYTYRANRLAHFLANPDDDEHQVVCHTCDNKSCCNPNHLILGSLKENKEHAINRGKISRVKMTWEIVRKIREEYVKNPDMSHSDLNDIGKEFGIELSYGAIMRMCKNEGWYDKNYNPPERKNQRGIGNRDNNGKFIKKGN